MTPQAEPLVSILTPVYNGAKFLRECIESVQAQTYGNWQYTILNNCSTDESLEIAQEYAASDSRIKVYSNQEFAGALRNHNLALRRMSPESKYCKFVFADDWIFPECIRRMVEVAEAHEQVGIVGAYRLVGTQLQLDGLPYTVTTVAGRDIGRARLLGGPYLFGSASSLLFRSELVRHREQLFNEANLHADAEACFDLLRECDFGFVHQVLTYTRPQEKESVSTFSNKYHTYIAGDLHDLVHYGPTYLSEMSLSMCLIRPGPLLRFSGVECIRRADRTFWTITAEVLLAMDIR